MLNTPALSVPDYTLLCVKHLQLMDWKSFVNFLQKRHIYIYISAYIHILTFHLGYLKIKYIAVKLSFQTTVVSVFLSKKYSIIIC